ncbi:dtdp-4-dehydrorhamnose 3 5-epimerase [Lucifera butyrica]|uniref:dTDP-4-dehydrorhamnose 3,5-epimerase n=1 Tax=Lucifera butyrica TaxID=1351585 RepID=A0A498R4S4_9FIRM|nr:dTDP-4-dehydrorhamnose 3,5-epimerase [Lucifera butyrica]VBB05183.1 dtdp-4-dehydrorhamnose 3 5-epimerase [Lucifera butyrica]
MIFHKTGLEGAFLVEYEANADERGFFARTWCRREFVEQGLNPELVQCSISFNKKKGTLRGMHYQAAPYAEAKLVRCTRGAIYDVIIDLRPDSPDWRRWFGVELAVANNKMLYVPEGFAHGFITLADNTEVFYQMSAYYQPEATKGVRWNDPAFGIQWPIPVEMISRKDESYGAYWS